MLGLAGRLEVEPQRQEPVWKIQNQRKTGSGCLDLTSYAGKTISLPLDSIRMYYRMILGWNGTWSAIKKLLFFPPREISKMRFFWSKPDREVLFCGPVNRDSAAEFQGWFCLCVLLAGFCGRVCSAERKPTLFWFQTNAEPELVSASRRNPRVLRYNAGPRDQEGFMRFLLSGVVYLWVHMGHGDGSGEELVQAHFSVPMPQTLNPAEHETRKFCWKCGSRFSSRVPVELSLRP